MFVILIRTMILFVIVVFAMRLMGKRTIGELQASEFVIILMISDVAAVPMQEIGIPLLAGVLPILVLVTMEITVSCITLKWAGFSRIVNGKPVMIVINGKPQRDALKKLRMTNEDLFEALRKQGIFDIDTVRYALVETDGNLSVLQRSDDSPPTANDMKLTVPTEQINALVVSDGNINKQSLRLIGWSEAKVEKILRKKNLTLKDIYILTGKTNGDYSIITIEQAKKGEN